MNTASVSEFYPHKKNPLQGLVSKAERVAVYIPTTMHDQPASEQVVAYQREKVAEMLSRWFGGFTEITGMGGWYSEQTGKLIRETVYIVYAVAEAKAIKRIIPRLVEVARSIAVAMEQEAVAIEVSGETYFVPAVEEMIEL